LQQKKEAIMAKEEIIILSIAPTFLVGVIVDLVNSCGGWAQFAQFYSQCMF